VDSVGEKGEKVEAATAPGENPGEEGSDGDAALLLIDSDVGAARSTGVISAKGAGVGKEGAGVDSAGSVSGMAYSAGGGT
jgi:hypothetical protein